ncbi:MAG TPA: sigma 54-interacting transcriptional regulator [Acidobacteriota bacterium]|nr:sigma 54-interacting transcriptional regulator [Acidobacteriota bacterium]
MNLTPPLHDGIHPTNVQVFLKIQEEVAHATHLGSFLDALAPVLSEFFSFESLVLLLPDEETEGLRVRYQRGTAIPTLPEFHSDQLSEVERCLIHNGINHYRLFPFTIASQQTGFLMLLGVQPLAMSQSDSTFLQALHRQISVAITQVHRAERAHQTETDLKQRLDQMQSLLEVTNTTTSHLELRALFKAIAESIHRMIRCEGAALTIYDAQSGGLRAFALEPRPDFQPKAPLFIQEGDLLPIDDFPITAAFRTRQTKLVSLDFLQQSKSPFVQKALALGFKSGCAAPLISQGKAIGTVSVVRLTEGSFTAADAELLTKIANQIAIAVDNALNFERARQAEQQVTRERDLWRFLLDVNNAVVSHLDLKDLVKTIASQLKHLMPVEFSGISLLDGEGTHLRGFTCYLAGEIELLDEGDVFPLEGTPGGLSFTTGQPLRLGHLDLDQFPASAPYKAVSRCNSCCLVPLTSHGRKLGLIGVGSTQVDAFTEDHLNLLVNISSQVAIAVENVLNFERARQAEQQASRERDLLRFLLDVNNAVVSHLDLQELVKTISTSLTSLMPFETIGLALYDAEQNYLRIFANNLSADQGLLRAGDVFHLEGTPAGWVFKTGNGLLLKQPDFERFPADRDYVAARGRLSGCIVPLISHGRKLGVIGISSSKTNTFTESDLELLKHISGQVAIAVENALAYQEIELLKNKLTQEKLYLEEELHTVWNFEQIIGTSPAFRRILKQVETVAPTNSTVLIYGETGTGKEIIARAIHNLSERRDRTLVKLNCAAIPTGLLESELFGHEKGAFTGAIAQRAGRFELAHRGTLLLDEIGEISLELQPKLLRVLQEQEFERLGSTRTQRVDFRLVAATNRDLAHMVEHNQFRRDLYYRLNVFPITLPPLRERQEDIPLLVRYFASKFAKRMGKRIETIPAESMTALTKYHWPGNIRELENFIERATILTSTPQLDIPLAELKPKTTAELPSANTTHTTLEENEREHIVRVLRETNWVVGGPSGAAVKLGLKRTTLQSRMEKLGITRQ